MYAALRNFALLTLPTALVVLAFSCKDLQPLSPRAQLFACRVQALAPLVGDLDAAETVARRIYAGEISLAEVVAGFKPAQSELAALLTALQACEPVQASDLTDAGVPL